MRIEQNAARILRRLAQGTCTVATLTRSDQDRHNTHFVLRQLKNAGCVVVSMSKEERCGRWSLTPSGEMFASIVEKWDAYSERQDNAMRARIRDDRRTDKRGRAWRAKV